MLAQHFLAVYSRQMEKSVGGFTPEVLRTFLEHEWRGNVRELEKTVKRMVVLADDGDRLGLDLLPVEMREHLGPAAAAVPAGAGRGARTLRSSVSELERQVIADALKRNRFNKTRVARELGLSFPTLLSRIRAYHLEDLRSET